MDNYPIKPSDIDTTKHFFEAFGESHTETSASWLVRLAQKNGDWRNFTKAEIDAFGGHKFFFNELLKDESRGPSPIKKNEDGSFSFTHEFVARCFLASPAKKVVFQ